MFFEPRVLFLEEDGDWVFFLFLFLSLFGFAFLIFGIFCVSDFHRELFYFSCLAVGVS